MLRLLTETYGNRCPDAFGNVHVARDDLGRTAFRHPGNYVGRHRQEPLPRPLGALLAWWYGEDV
jgi:hypothetical protein